VGLAPFEALVSGIRPFNSKAESQRHPEGLGVPTFLCRGSVKSVQFDTAGDDQNVEGGTWRKAGMIGKRSRPIRAYKPYWEGTLAREV
jgi:hypothetical protein